MVNKLNNLAQKSNTKLQKLLNNNLNNILLGLTCAFLILIIFKNITDHFTSSCKGTTPAQKGACLDTDGSYITDGRVIKIPEGMEHEGTRIKCTENGAFFCE